MPNAKSTAGISAQSRRIFGALDAFLGKAEWVVLGVAGLIALVVMVVVSADALGRYMFNKPLIFTLDLVSRYLLPVIMLSTAGAVLRKSRHISVDLFAMMMPTRVYQALLGIALAVAVPVFWIMCSRVALASLESFEQGKVAMGLIAWPLWLEQAIYAVCMGLLVIRIAQVAVANLLAAILDDEEIGISLQQSHAMSPEEFEESL